MNWKKIAIFAGGFIFGTAGVKLLGSREAKKTYTHSTAAVLRAKDCVMSTVTKIREEADDILASAKDINDSIASEEMIIEDDSIV